MEPGIRISCHGSLTVTVDGLTSELATLLRDLIRSSDSGAGIKPAPFSFTEAQLGSSSHNQTALELCGTSAQVKCILRKISGHGAEQAQLAKKIDSLLDNYLRSDYKIECKGAVLDLSSRTHLMGILNVTPDSFSDGGRYLAAEHALRHAREMISMGADILDIGGESTRPGSQPVSAEEELSRIIPIIERIAAESSVLISVDTYKSTVARKALAAGASVVNDISGLRFSPDMAEVAAAANAAVVIMHTKGMPRDMQHNPVYDDVVPEVMAYLGEGIELAVKAGVDREKILIDPGIGFGKTLEHNLSLLRRLDEFRGLGRPILLGTSRKKFIGTILDLPVPEERVDGTAATVALGIERGAHIVRVHDVARMKQVARMTDALKSKF
jgi:dihydropteroate synthase